MLNIMENFLRDPKEGASIGRGCFRYAEIPGRVRLERRESHLRQ